ncbi:hypothetical protein ABK040_011802 [Willaertia magna]
MSEKHTIGIFGPFAVGKTSVTVQYIEKKFSEVHDPTIEDYFETSRDIFGIVCNITILDTAGQETYSSLVSDAMNDAEGFILVYSITDKESFEKVKKLREKITMVQDNNVPMILVGNKCDLEDQRQITKEEGENLSKEFNCSFIETSAKTGFHIDELFEQIILILRKKKKLPLKKDESVNASSSSVNGNNESGNTSSSSVHSPNRKESKFEGSTSKENEKKEEKNEKKRRESKFQKEKNEKEKKDCKVM